MLNNENRRSREVSPPPTPASGGDVKKEAALTFKTASFVYKEE